MHTRRLYHHELITNIPSQRRLGPKTAILKGIAIDLKDSMIFPAVFDWAQFSDFQVRIRGNKICSPNEGIVWLHDLAFLSCSVNDEIEVS